MRLSILTNHGATDGDVADMDAARAIIDWELGRDGVTGATITVGADAEAPTGVVESWPFAEVVATPGITTSNLVALSGRGMEACRWLSSHPHLVATLEVGLDAHDVGKIVPLPICRRVEPFRTGGVMPRPEDG